MIVSSHSLKYSSLFVFFARSVKLNLFSPQPVVCCILGISLFEQQPCCHDEYFHIWSSGISWIIAFSGLRNRRIYSGVVLEYATCGPYVSIHVMQRKPLGSSGAKRHGDAIWTFVDVLHAYRYGQLKIIIESTILNPWLGDRRRRGDVSGHPRVRRVLHRRRSWRLFLSHGLMLRFCLEVLRSLMLQHGLMLRCGLEVLRSPMLQHGLTIRRGLEASSNPWTIPQPDATLMCTTVSLQGGHIAASRCFKNLTLPLGKRHCAA